MILRNFGADIEFFFQAWSLFCMKYYINFCLKTHTHKTSHKLLGTGDPFALSLKSFKYELLKLSH